MSIEKGPAPLSQRHVQNCSLIHPSNSEKSLVQIMLEIDLTRASFTLSHFHLNRWPDDVIVSITEAAFLRPDASLASDGVPPYDNEPRLGCNNHFRPGRGEAGVDFSESFLRIFMSPT